MKKYFKARGRPPVLVSEEEWDLLTKGELKSKSKKQNKKESEE